MATIANLTVKSDGTMEGTLATLTVQAPIAIIPNGPQVEGIRARLPHHQPQDRL